MSSSLNSDSFSAVAEYSRDSYKDMDDDDNDNYQDSDSGTSSTRRYDINILLNLFCLRRLPSRKTREELNAIEKQRQYLIYSSPSP